MKKIFLVVIAFAMANVSMAQSSPIDKLFDKYSGKEGYTSIFISKYMFNMFSSIDPDDKELQGVLGGLSGIKILATQTPQIGINFYKEVMNELSEKDYKELMVIKEKDKDMKFLIKDVEGRVIELLLLIGGSENVLICIQGDNINMKNISNLSKSMNIDGLENLEKINEQ